MLYRISRKLHAIERDARALYSAVRANGAGVRAKYGKSVMAQITEMIRLRRGAGRLAPDEYYQYGLYDDARFTFAQKQEFFGRQMEKDLCKVLDSAAWSAVAHDKLMSYAVFRAFELPYPQVYAVYNAQRSYGSTPTLKDAELLGDYLRNNARYPLIAKPIQGMWGEGVYALGAYDAGRDELVLTSGQKLKTAEFVARIAAKESQGYLFQELLRSHPVLQRYCGDRICSVRVVIILDPEPRVVSTLWKVATGAAMADNFWEPGNLVGPVDEDSGEVGQLFTGMGLQRKDVCEHPDTGERLVGITLPDWQEAMSLCKRAAASLPGLEMQAWDVALTERGPVLLEVNIIGGVRLPQLVINRGMFHGSLRAFLNRHGYH